MGMSRNQTAAFDAARESYPAFAHHVEHGRGRDLFRAVVAGRAWRLHSPRWLMVERIPDMPRVVRGGTCIETGIVVAIKESEVLMFDRTPICESDTRRETT